MIVIALTLYFYKFVLKNNFFEFNSEVYHQLPGTDIGTNRATICIHFHGSSWK